jgi:hypothetical protein
MLQNAITFAHEQRLRHIPTAHIHNSAMPGHIHSQDNLVPVAQIQREHLSIPYTFRDPNISAVVMAERIEFDSLRYVRMPEVFVANSRE